LSHIDRTPAEGGLGYRCVSFEVISGTEHHLERPGRYVDKHAVMATTGFEQQNLRIVISHKPVGRDASGASPANDDVVVTHFLIR
jgi:hypothetical protein